MNNIEENYSIQALAKCFPNTQKWTVLFGVDRTVNLTTYIYRVLMKRKKNTFFVQPLLLNARRRHRVWKTISIVETYNTTERWLDWRRQHETLWLFDNREKRTLFFPYRRRASSSPSPCLCLLCVVKKILSVCCAAARGLVTSLEITQAHDIHTYFCRKLIRSNFKWVYDQVQSPKLSSNTYRRFHDSPQVPSSSKKSNYS